MNSLWPTTPDQRRPQRVPKLQQGINEMKRKSSSWYKHYRWFNHVRFLRALSVQHSNDNAMQFSHFSPIHVGQST